MTDTSPPPPPSAVIDGVTYHPAITQFDGRYPGHVPLPPVALTAAIVYERDGSQYVLHPRVDAVLRGDVLFWACDELRIEAGRPNSPSDCWRFVETFAPNKGDTRGHLAKARARIEEVGVATAPAHEVWLVPAKSIGTSVRGTLHGPMMMLDYEPPSDAVRQLRYVRMALSTPERLVTMGDAAHALGHDVTALSGLESRGSWVLAPGVTVDDVIARYIECARNGWRQ